MEVVTEDASRPRSSGRDLIFAWKVCRHVRSNAIVLAKDSGDDRHRRRPDEPRRLASGSRSRRRATPAARRPSECSRGCVVASDAFFPFADGPQAAIDAGATRSDPARRLEARRRGDRGLRRGRRGDGLHRPPPLPPLGRSGSSPRDPSCRSPATPGRRDCQAPGEGSRVGGFGGGPIGGTHSAPGRTRTDNLNA